jgi:hypothetical protein
VSAPALQKLKSIPSKNFKNATHNRHKNSWTETAKTYTGQGLTMTEDRRPACNTGLAKVAVQCSADTFVINQSLVVRINICGENRHLRQARKRYCKAAWGTTREEIDSVCLAFFTDRQAPRNLTA